MSRIEFVPFRPLDFPTGAYQNGSSTAIFNLAPVEGFGYVPFGAPTSAGLSDALDTDTRGGSSYLVGGVIYIYAGTVGRLYHYNKTTDTLTNVSQGGGTPYTTSTTDWGWSFTRWGDGVIATNYVDAVQFKPSLTATTAFVDLFTSTLKPKAKFMGLVKNQLFLANTSEGGTAYPQRVRWGAVDDALDMDASPTTMADYQDLLDDFGDITGFVGGDYGVVFKERALYKVSFVGPPLFYRFDLIASGVGTRSPGSIVEFQGSVFFWGANNIYRLLPDAAGVERVEEGIFKALMTNYTLSSSSSGWPASIVYDKTRPQYVHAAVDTALGCIYWAFPSAELGVLKQILACVPSEGRSTASYPIAPLPDARYVTWCIQGPYTGKERHIAAPAEPAGGASATVFCVDDQKKINMFEAALDIAPRIVSGFISPALGKRAVITAVRPIFLSTGNIAAEARTSPVTGIAVLEVGYEGIVSASNTFTAATSANGWWYGKANGPFLAISTTFQQAYGLTPSSIPAVCAGWEIIFDEEDGER